MDARLKTALENANYRQQLGIERNRLRDIALSKLVIAYNGGTFTTNKELISFISSIVDHETAVVLDDNEYPVNIEDLSEFLKVIKTNYFSSTFQYLADYSEIKQKRSAEKLLDL